MSDDPIDRLADVPHEDYADALSILFISYGRLPRMRVAFGNERTVLIEVINKSSEALRTIRTAINKFDRYTNDHLKFYISKIEADAEKMSKSTDMLIASMSHVAVRQTSREEFTLLDQSFKAGVIAMMLRNALAKHEQQGTSFIGSNAFNLLSSSYLKIIEPWEQASVCHRCPNFEQIVAIHPWRESKCSKCGQDNLTIRVYALDQSYETHKKNNKDLPLFISNLVNRKQKLAAVTTKDLSDFKINDLVGDIDVWIEKTLTGIECKLRSSDSKATDEQLRTYVKDIEEDLRKYIRAGVKNLIVVTNLDEEDARKSYNLLYESVGCNCDSLKVLPKSIRSIIEMVCEQAEAIRKSGM